MHHRLNPASRQNRSDTVGVADVAFDPFKRLAGKEIAKIAAFDGGVIKRIEIIQPDDLPPLTDQPLA